MVVVVKSLRIRAQKKLFFFVIPGGEVYSAFVCVLRAVVGCGMRVFLRVEWEGKKIPRVYC